MANIDAYKCGLLMVGYCCSTSHNSLTFWYWPETFKQV